MTVLLRLVNGQPGGVVAEVDGGVWRCADSDLLARLPRDADLDRARESDPHFGYVPNRDAALAELAVERFGGAIIQRDIPEPLPDEVAGRLTF